MGSKKKAIYIAISILVAVLLWLYADTNNGTEVSTAANEIPVEFINQDSTLADRGLMLLSSQDVTINLRLRARRAVIANLDTSAIRIQVDMATVATSGVHAMNYSIIYPANISPSDIAVESASAYNLLVNVGELFRKDVEIRHEVKGTVAEDYVAGAVELLPEKLEIRGQQADVLQVAYAKVVLEIDNPAETTTQMLSYELYDANDNLIENSSLRANCDSIQVTLPVNMVKDVPLAVNFVESDGAHLSNVEYSIVPRTVTVTGDAQVVRQLEKIELGTVVLENLGSSDTFTYTIEPPAGITNLSSETAATVTVAFKDLTSRTLTVSNISCENLSSDREVSIVTTSLPVKLRGTSEDLNRLKEQQVRLVADLTDLSSAVGTYTVPVTVRVDSSGDIGTVGAYQIIVRISEKVPADTGGDANAPAGGSTNNQTNR